MSRLTVVTKNQAQETVETLYKDVERRIVASQPGLCPVELTSTFVHLSHAQSCGKCTPCRVGLERLEELINQVLNGKATNETLSLIENTAKVIFLTADCAIGYEAARMVLKGLKGFREDFEEHIERGRCRMMLKEPVPCQFLCPAHVNIPGYIALVYNKKYSEAVRLIRNDNPFPAVCGLICEHPCEARCRRSLIDDPINIRGLKRYAVEHEGEVKIPERAAETGKKVAVIGGGPAGLSAAYYLSLMGHEVMVYEQRKKLGGMLRYGIPAYRLPREILDDEIGILERSGFKYATNVSIGKDISLAKLREEYDALYISIGAHQDRKIGIEGEDANGVISAVDMLRSIGDDEMMDFTGLDIAVVGGGNVAMDVARSAVRLGAKSVKVAYRRRKNDMTALDDEIEGAIADRVEINGMNAPVRIEKDENGNVAALWVQPQKVGEIRGSRPDPKKADKDEERWPCDRVLVAIGQGIDSDVFQEFGIPVHRGTIEALSSAGVKNTDGIFAGGDCVTGPATVIQAIAGGKVAAVNIDEYLGFEHDVREDIEIPPIHLDDNNPHGRVEMLERPAAERIHDFDLIECPMSDEEACQESARCLKCDHFGSGIIRGGRAK